MLTDEEAAFLRARLDEDEAVAQGAARTDDGHAGDWLPVYFGAGGFDARVDDHIARHDPARVLREVEADRKLLDLYERAKGYRDRVFALQPPRSVSDEMRAVTQMMALEQVLRLRAAVYSGAQADGTGPHPLAEG